MATGWREQLTPAAFRGVPFFVQAHEGDFGRRVALHEYPGRDKPWAEDLGRRARTLSVEALVLGAGYMAQRDALLAAVEQAGAGTLKHPYLGELKVVVLECRLSESTAEGGQARFALQFVEAGEATWPRPTGSTPDQVAAKAEPAMTAAQSAFEAGLKVAKQPDFVASALSQQMGGLLSQVRSAAGQVQSALEPLAELQRQVDVFRADLTELVYEPAALAQGVLGAVRQLVRSVATTPGDALGLARTLWRFGSLSFVPGGASLRRLVQMNNQVETARLVRTAAVTEAARAVSTLAFDSFDQAAALRGEFADVMDELLYATADDTAFDAMRALRAAVIADISARGADLARLFRYTPGGSIPALVLAHQLYGDALRADELLARNGGVISHPLFVQGGQTLEVLADA